MGLWVQVVFDIFEGLVSLVVFEEVLFCGMFEVLLLIYIWGCLLYDLFVIVDEVQLLECNVLLIVLFWLGIGFWVVLIYDIVQCDNLWVGCYDGVVVVIEKFKGYLLFVYIILLCSECLLIVVLVIEMFEEIIGLC